MRKRNEEAAWVLSPGHFHIADETKEATLRHSSVMPSTQQFYTVKEAAAILKVSEDTIRRVMKRGLIAFVEISPRTRRIAQRAIDRFIEQGMEVRREA